MVKKKNTLRKKLFRDMWQNRMQFLAMIFLCTFGSFAFSGLDAAWRMLYLSSNTYFENQQVADIWVTVQAADREKLACIGNIDGVDKVQARATAELKVDLPDEPSLMVAANDGPMNINLPLMYEGEELDASDRRGCLLDMDFAKANGLNVGDRLVLKLAGREYDFIIRGTCRSAEYLGLSKNMVREPKEYGFVLLNSCGFPQLPMNSIIVKLEKGADSMAVQNEIKSFYPEAIMVDHSTQPSISGINRDANMYKNLSYLFPLLAFAVAAMIVSTTITRMLQSQRTQMGTLKALGYSDGPLLWHYMSYAFYPSLIGSLLGLYIGRATLPYMLWNMEETQFAFPYCMQVPISIEQWAVCAVGVIISCFICWRTYRKSAKLQAAALLRPEPPKAGRKLLLERWKGLWTHMGFNSKMVTRNLFRNKARTLMSLVGILCCTMLIITSLGLQDSVKYFVAKYYDGSIQYSVRADLDSEVGTPESYVKRIDAERVESVMDMTVSMRSARRSRTTQLTIYEDDQRLMNFGKNERWIPMPRNGILLSIKLAEALDVKPGDDIEIWLAGDDKPIYTKFAGTAEITMGQNAMMRRSLWEAQKKGDFTPTALFIKNPTPEGMRRLNDLDELEELHYPQDQYNDTMKIMDSLMGVFALLSGVALGLAFVVLYNMGILNFMERTREYATLKVLGYHQKEIRKLMITENDIITILGVLLGIGPGWLLTSAVLKSCEGDTMVFASTVNPISIVVACVVTYLFSCLINRLLTRKVRSIDMVEALKSVE